jgi:hypothetical protein
MWPFTKSSSTLILEQLQQINAGIRRLNGQLFSVIPPGSLGITVTPLSQDGSMLTFSITLPPPGANDVVSRQLTIARDDTTDEPTVITLPGDATESADMTGEQGLTVLAQLIDIDDAGNQSAPSNATFVLADTIAPPAPGALGIAVKAEN